jgi:hypothetical protein
MQARSADLQSARRLLGVFGALGILSLALASPSFAIAPVSESERMRLRAPANCDLKRETKSTTNLALNYPIYCYWNMALGKRVCVY